MGGKSVTRYYPGVSTKDQTPAGISSRDEIPEWGAKPGKGPTYCGWCGKQVDQGSNSGRKRQYCGQACRQRAYERRISVERGGLPSDAVVLSAAEVAALQDRLFQLRCAAEDVVTAAEEGAGQDELRGLAGELAQGAHALERLR